MGVVYLNTVQRCINNFITSALIAIYANHLKTTIRLLASIFRRCSCHDLLLAAERGHNEVGVWVRAQITAV